jgi:hypothetical protein
LVNVQAQSISNSLRKILEDLSRRQWVLNNEWVVQCENETNLNLCLTCWDGGRNVAIWILNNLGESWADTSGLWSSGLTRGASR